MAHIIKISILSKDKEKIKTVKQWAKKTRIPHENRAMSPVLVPINITLTPEDISNYAAALNTIFPNERVTDFAGNTFITVKKDVFSKVCFGNNFYQDYYMELDEEENIWSIKISG